MLRSVSDELEKKAQLLGLSQQAHRERERVTVVVLNHYIAPRLSSWSYAGEIGAILCAVTIRSKSMEEKKLPDHRL